MRLKSYASIIFATTALLASASNYAQKPIRISCPFDPAQNCTLFKDVLNDKDGAGLMYYGPTNYDHRISGEIETFDANLVQPYTDNVNAPGQIKLTAVLNNNVWKSGEIMTRPNLDQPPYNSPKKIHPLTTNDIQHGYMEVKLKTPRCETSDDGLCQAGTNPQEYSRGLWPSVWMLPTHDTDWPLNGEIDIWELYQQSKPLNVSTSTLHFNGNDPRCGGNDCKFIGFDMGGGVSNNGPMYNSFHTWGFEWQPDPTSTGGGVILTEYFDGVKLWGPIKTDSLPADGPGAFRRGFHDPNGGFYIIAAVALGGGYAGNPNPHMRSATMYIQSLKVYSVGGSTQQGDLKLNFGSIPVQCQGAADVLNIGPNDHPNVTVGQPLTYTMQTGTYQVSLKSNTQPIPVNGGTCQGTLNAGQVTVPGQLTANYTFTATPIDKGTIQILPTSQSDSRCVNSTDTLFLDQNQAGTQFVVGTGVSQQVVVGQHTIKLQSGTSIPAPNGTCTSTLSANSVNVTKNTTSTVNATYTFHDNSSGQKCIVSSSKVTQQSDWGSGIINTFQIVVNLQDFPADPSGKMTLNGQMTMKNDFYSQFWSNFSMTTKTTGAVGTFNGDSWSTQLIFGGFIKNKVKMHLGDDPLVAMQINGFTCR